MRFFSTTPIGLGRFKTNRKLLIRIGRAIARYDRWISLKNSAKNTSQFGLRIEVNFSRRRPTSMGFETESDFKTTRKLLIRIGRAIARWKAMIGLIPKKNQQLPPFTFWSSNRDLLFIPSSYEIEFGRNDELSSATDTTRLKGFRRYPTLGFDHESEFEGIFQLLWLFTSENHSPNMNSFYFIRNHRF